MVNPRILFKALPTKAFAAIGLTTIGLTALLHFFMTYAVFPKQGGTISLYVPAKSGGKNFFIDVSEFHIASYIALAVTVLATVLVIVLLRAKKELEATIVMLWLVALSVMYLATYGGNALHEMWGSGWSIVGVILLILIGLVLELPLINSMSRLVGKQAKKKSP